MHHSTVPLSTQEENLLSLLRSVEPDPVLLSVVEVDAEGDSHDTSGAAQPGAGSRSEGGTGVVDDSNRQTDPVRGTQPSPERSSQQALGMTALPSTVSAPLMGRGKHAVRFKDGIETKSAAAAAEEGLRGGSGVLGGQGPGNVSGKFRKGVGILVPALAAKLKREEFQRLVFRCANGPEGAQLEHDASGSVAFCH